MTYCSLDFEKPKEISEADLGRMVAFLTQMADFTGKMAVKFTINEN